MGPFEHQIASVVYWPEYYNEIVFSLEGTGVFKADLRTGSVVEFPPIETQDTLNDIIVSYWKHSSLRERGRIDEILLDLELAGGRLRTITPAEVKEALETRGRRAIILRRRLHPRRFHLLFDARQTRLPCLGLGRYATLDR